MKRIEYGYNRNKKKIWMRRGIKFVFNLPKWGFQIVLTVNVTGKNKRRLPSLLAPLWVGLFCLPVLWFSSDTVGVRERRLRKRQPSLPQR